MSVAYPGLWNWEPLTVIDLHTYQLRKSQPTGDSDVYRAWPATGRRSQPPTYLVKLGRDAVAELVYATIAHYLDLPHQVVHWAGGLAEPLAVAIRYEATAYRPAQLPAELRNPWDYYGCWALNAFTADGDGLEFMIRDGVLFGIDAAAQFELSTWWFLPWPLARLMRRAAPMNTSWDWLSFNLEHLATKPAAAQYVFGQTLQQLTAPEVLQQVSRALRMYPPGRAYQPALLEFLSARQQFVQQHAPWQAWWEQVQVQPPAAELQQGDVAEVVTQVSSSLE